MTAHTGIRHGTYSGAQKHRRLGIPACEPCLEAHREYMREYRRSNAYRDVRRNAYARNATLREFRDLAPDLYRRVYREYADEWEAEHPKETP